jgi:hypothetical protein
MAIAAKSPIVARLVEAFPLLAIAVEPGAIISSSFLPHHLTRLNFHLNRKGGIRSRLMLSHKPSAKMFLHKIRFLSGEATPNFEGAYHGYWGHCNESLFCTSEECYEIFITKAESLVKTRFPHKTAKKDRKLISDLQSLVVSKHYHIDTLLQPGFYL